VNGQLRARLDDEHATRRIQRVLRELGYEGDVVSGTDIRTVLLGTAIAGVTEHERALATGAAMDMYEELLRLRALAEEVDRVAAALGPLAERGLRTQAATVRDRLKRARELSRGR
jgi:hypothetical protein